MYKICFAVVTVSLELDSYTSEEGNELNICAELQSGFLEREVFFLIDLDDGTATLGWYFVALASTASLLTSPPLFSGMDFSVSQNPTLLSFEIGSPLGSTSCVTVPITNDTIVEAIENFDVELIHWINQPVVIDSPSSAITLIEQDPADG